MIWKCGATVKRSRPSCFWARPKARTCSTWEPVDLPRSPLCQAGLRPGEDGTAFAGRRVERAGGGGALEQHPALEIARAEVGVAFEHLVAHCRIIHRHQADRLDEARIFPRRGDRLFSEKAGRERRGGG